MVYYNKPQRLKRGRFLVCVILVWPGLLTSVAGETICEWNRTLLTELQHASALTPPILQARAYAMLNLAMRDAVVEVCRSAPKDAGAADIAASAAALFVAGTLCPQGEPRFRELHESHVRHLGKSSFRSRALDIGESAGGRVVAARTEDAWISGTLATASIGSPWEKAMPFNYTKVDRFRVPSPYIVFDDDTVLPNPKLKNSAILGRPETARGRVPSRWSQTGALTTWFQLMEQSVPPGADITRRVQCFAILSTALADTLLSCAHWRYVYGSARRETVGSFSGRLPNENESEDLPDVSSDRDAWPIVRPLPYHPRQRVLAAVRDYPAVAAALAGAAEAVLRRMGQTSFAVSSDGTGTEICSLTELARECAWSPLFESGASRESCLAGYMLGGMVGEFSAPRDKTKLR
jgi:hypothetical protein